jgi:GT2 family glycosyltransferase
MTTGLNVRLICQSNNGPGSARNSGAMAARGSLLVFIDDDCTPHPDWLTALSEASDQDPGALLGGPVINGLSGNLYAETTQLIITFLREMDQDATGRPKFFSTCNMAAPRQAFLQIGGFNTDLRTGEDREFCYRWRAANRPVIDVPDAVVFHWNDLDWKRFWKLHVSYGRGSALYRRLIAQQEQRPFRIESWRYYRRLLTYPVVHYGVSRAIPIIGLLLLSQLATAIGYISAGWRQMTDASGEKLAD